MLDESLRRRLESLNREQLPRPPLRTSVVRNRRTATPAESAPVRGLAPLLPRGTVTDTARGEHLTVSLPVAEIWPAGERLLRSRHEQLTLQVERQSPGEQLSFVTAFPHQFVALDLETCGLGGAPLFLAGVVRQQGETLTVELLLARTYAEEAAVLCSLGERLAAAKALVTFNGKSFDWPTVGDRWRRHLLDRTQSLPTPTHFDVLHHARRRWRRMLPDCKLQTIERMICRRSRVGDIPGHRIPAAYDHFVRTGETTEMEQVLYHNAVDLVTLLEIAMRLAG